jgi:hypothetical protein
MSNSFLFTILRDGLAFTQSIVLSRIKKSIILLNQYFMFLLLLYLFQILKTNITTMKKLIFFIVFISMTVLVNAQNISYDDHSLTFKKKPTLPLYAGYTTFDMAAITTLDESEVNMNLPYQIKLGDYKQVPVFRSSGKFTADNSITLNVYIISTIYDRYGNKISSVYIDEPARVVNFERALTKDERNNKDFTRQKIVEKLTEVCMVNFLNQLKGETVDIPFELCGLGSVKKLPALADFSKTVKDVKTNIDIETLKTVLEPSVPYWQKMAEYAGEGDTNEVRRAAFQNLAIYNIVAGKIDDANMVIEKYNAIDKVDKRMFGMVKIMHSDNCSKMMAKVNMPEVKIEETTALQDLNQLKSSYRC